ncbi:uncharacterized protein [Drosophila suzukii]|uniref:Uncharacterized protein n=1 Tax=Drosophila suzukii TaxID=28584 RepID=A0ABM4TYE1_DROSZ
MHHPLLHSENVPNLANETGNQRHVSTHQGDVEGNQFFRIVPVTLHYDDNKIEVFAFLDEGSSVTLIDASIQISGVSSEKRYWLNNVDMDELRSKYSYLKDLPLETYSTQPMLLIGTNNWKIAVPRRIREGKWNDPIASKCMLGWTIQGSANSNRHVSMHHCDCNWRELHDEVKEQFNLESILPKKLISSEDKRVVEILEQTCQNKCGKYEVGLLRRNGLQRLRESRTTALKRLQCIRSKILSEPDLFTKIDDQIKNLLDKGYAKQLSDEEAKKEETRTRYLPIFIALNPNKPGKIRLVWDAAAKTNKLLSGPDCLNPLIDVLLAFRVGAIAVSVDIAEMFHRINIRHEDMHSQRFLCCAPLIAHYVRDKNAEVHQQQFALCRRLHRQKSNDQTSAGTKSCQNHCWRTGIKGSCCCLKWQHLIFRDATPQGCLLEPESACTRSWTLASMLILLLATCECRVASSREKIGEVLETTRVDQCDGSHKNSTSQTGQRRSSKTLVWTHGFTNQSF